MGGSREGGDCQDQHIGKMLLRPVTASCMFCSVVLRGRPILMKSVPPPPPPPPPPQTTRVINGCKSRIAGLSDSSTATAVAGEQEALAVRRRAAEVALRLVDRTRHRVIASSRHRVIVPSCTILVVFGAFHTSDIIGIDWCTRNDRLSYGTREDTRVCALSETCARSRMCATMQGKLYRDSTPHRWSR